MLKKIKKSKDFFKDLNPYTLFGREQPLAFRNE